MNFLYVPERTKRMRTYGLTSITDFGIPIGSLKHMLEDYHPYIDIAKLGVGTGYVTPDLQAKIALYQSYNIHVYCGGTLFEKCYLQGKLDEYFYFLKRHNIHWIEISNGTVEIPLEKRLAVISKAKKDFFVLGEVGSKDTDKEMDVEEWTNEIQTLLQAGCQYVITEGRDSGTAGIYNKEGAVKQDIIMEVVENINVQRIIFEAPSPKYQMYFINLFGSNVNLGNVKMEDVLLLETQRCGLRSETFYLAEEMKPIK